ncbi:MAG: hypothetical protein OEM26_11075 [Saprospiraceae bacterium]|nr:hypothetical protein [Saprospiraceae bacterium]
MVRPGSFVTYQSFQFSWFLFALIPLEFWLFYLFVAQVGSKPLSPVFFAITQGFLLLVCVLFYGLRVKVTSDQIKLSYGIGLIKFSFDLSEIKSVQVVRNPWYFGFGIRLIPNGMLYNIHGLDAVELHFRNKSRIVRVGSPEVEILKYEIDKRLS